MNLHELRRRRSEIGTELRGLIDRPAGEDGDLSAEQRTQFEALQATVAALDTRIARAEAVDEIDRRAAGQHVAGGEGSDAFEALARQVTALDVIRAQMGATDAAAGRAREVSAELERRSGRRAEGLLFSMRLSGAPLERRVFTTTNPAGGPGSNLIETNVLGTSLIDRLRDRLIVRRLGATILSGLTGNVSIPRLKASATAYWVAENSPITASDPQTDAVTMTPKHVGGLVEISRNMILQPSLDVARMVEADLSQIIAAAIDAAAIKGGGTNEPSGVLASGSGITVVAGGTNGLAPSWANLVALIAAVDVANAADAATVGFAITGRVRAKLMTTLKTTGDTASNFILSDMASGTLAGFPFQSSQIVPSNLTKGSGTNLSAIIFGDWAQLVVGFWSELDILVNPYESTAYPKGNVMIRAMATADVAIKQPLAFAAIVDAITT